MKLSLIRPPFVVEKFYFPRFINESLGIETLDAFLSQKHEINVIDAVSEGWCKYWELSEFPGTIFQGIKPKKILKKIIKFQPDAIGISWLFSTQNSSVDLIINSIRDFDKHIPIIVGGPHPSADPEYILKNNNKIDIVVYGEGELTAQELLDNKFQNLEKIKGIAFRKNNEIIINPPRELIYDLNIIPMPKRSKNKHKNFSKQEFYKALFIRLKKIKLNENILIKLTAIISRLPYLYKIYYKLYNNHNYLSLPAADIATSRGCPNHCTFCAVHNIWGHRWRIRSAENVLKEIDILVKKFKIKHLNIIDDNFNISKQRTIEICKSIVKNNYNITLYASSGSYLPTLDEEVLYWLKKAGLHHIRMSIESGNQDVLNNIIKKNINLKSLKPILDICKKLKIHSEGAFIFGIPGETIETMEQTLKYSESVGFDRVIKFIFQPFPNTELYKICVENNYLTKDYNPKKLYITGNKCYVKTSEFSPEDVLRIVNR